MSTSMQISVSTPTSGAANSSPEEGYTVAGQHYPTLASLSQAFNVKVTTLARRLRSRHWSIEQACGLASPPVSAANQGRPLSVNGVNYPSMAAACQTFNVKVEVYHARRRTGWSVEEALGIAARPAAPRPGAKTWTIEGKTYFSLRRACEAYNLNADRVRSRLSMGWTLEEAFDLSPRQAPAPVPLDMKRGETGTLIICGQPFVWKSDEVVAPNPTAVSAD